MAAIPLHEFEPFLKAFQSADGTTRKQAESALTELQKTPDRLTLSLLLALRTSKDEGVRQLSVVLLRDFLCPRSEDAQSLWTACSPEGRAALKQQLYDVVNSEPVRLVRRSTADTLADLAVSTHNTENWEDLFARVDGWVLSANPDLRDAGLYVIELLSQLLALRMQQLLPAMAGLLHGSISDAASPIQIRTSAAAAYTGIITSLEPRDPKLDAFQASLPAVLQLLGETTALTDETHLSKMLSLIIDICENHALFFKPNFLDYVSAANAIATGSKNAVVRRTAFEISLGLAEGAPSFARQLGDNHFLKTCLPVAIGMLVEHADDPGWEAREPLDEEDDDDFSNRAMGEAAILRISAAIKFKKFLPALSPHLATLLGSPEWTHRFGGLRALRQISESFPDNEEGLTAIANQIAPFARDAHPKVRWAVADAFSMFAYFKGIFFIHPNHAIIIPVLLHLLKDPSQRVRAMSADALICVFDQMLADYAKPYVDDVVKVLFEVLAEPGNSRSSKENALTAIGLVGELGDGVFSKHFDTFMPNLVSIITTLTDKSMRSVRGKALQCAASLGAGIPPERFRPYAEQLMKATVIIASEKAPGDDPLRPFMWECWVRIAQVLVHDFAPYLDIVMGQLLPAAQGTLDATLAKASADTAGVPGASPVAPPAAPGGSAAGAGAGGGMIAFGGAGAGAGDGDDDDDDYDSDDEDDEYEFSDDEGNTIKVKTATIQEQATAIHKMAEICLRMKGSFLPYVERAAKVSLPLVTVLEAAYGDVRAYAMELLPELVRTTSIATGYGDRGNLKTLLDACIQNLLDGFSHEEHMELIISLVISIKCCVDFATLVHDPLPTATPTPGAASGPAAVPHARPVDARYRVPMLDTEQLKSLTEALLMVRKDSIHRRSIRAAERTTYAAEFDEELLEDEDMKDFKEGELVYHIIETCGMLVQSHGEAYIPVFAEYLLDVVKTTAHPSCTVNDRKLAVFLMDDILEYGGAAAGVYVNDFVGLMCTLCEDPTPAIQQGAAYGIGATARSQGAAFIPSIPGSLTALHRFIMAPAGDKLAAIARDNALCALGKIIHCQAPHVKDIGALSQFWLDNLPLQSDKDESLVCTQLLCCRVDAKCPHILGASGEHLPKILAAWATSLVGEKLCTPALAIRIKGCLKSLPEAAIGAAWPALSKDAQVVLTKLLEDASVVA